MRFFADLHQLSDWGLLALRVGVGMSFWVHGTAKRAMWKMAPSPQMPAGLLSTLRLLSIVEPLGAVAAFAGFLMQTGRRWGARLGALDRRARPGLSWCGRHLTRPGIVRALSPSFRLVERHS